MKTLLRAIVWLALVVWLGGLLFFPITAWAAFSTIADTHQAGTIVAKCLAVAHHEGLVAGCLIIVLLAVGHVIGVYRKGVGIAFVVTAIMLLLTAFSQFWIIPHMERDRLAVGGAIDNVPATEPHHADFNRLHNVSIHLEEAVMLAGVILVVMLSRDNCE